ncbi:patatin-like phospholipase family protein [Sinomonas sp. JGH33]|uniref:Patatin-like phospholipase family protein n=1 Tax=Sinomonas terricola TaxID=3110330 RepID=A0ABU5TAW1_9MICC|nr:patatin-like phospholipase family protein [Sinomonas sp. JGH33]MEA5456657.1 patatin-like phospholipase family protein [Sinomonas sp. JGH33]
MKRSLVLAGGGMRVAWQAGVVRALSEEGIAFDHIDGSSGGILATGMLLSGISPEEMCARWSSLDVRDFSSALPLGDYLKGPGALPALGDADGILRKVFPALGIDADQIRRRAALPGAIEGTFNVAEFTRKVAHAIDARHIDAELMAAGMSLPLFVTPLERDGQVWTDAVWMRDANVREALRRGADEVWLVWCIGNSPYWGDGPFEQYVHMIEMCAMGALLADFDEAASSGREFVLHVIRPEHPLPLDPEFYLGRIDADALIGMGYRDARAYLDALRPGGVPHDESCTAMVDRVPGVRFNESLHGTAGGHELTVRVTLVVPTRDGTQAPEVTGYVDFAPFGSRVFLADGAVEADGGRVSYRGRVRVDGPWEEFRLTRTFDDGALDGWHDARHARLEVGGRVAVDVSMGLGDVAALLGSVEPVGVHGIADRAAAVAGFAARGLRELFGAAP